MRPDKRGLTREPRDREALTPKVPEASEPHMVLALSAEELEALMPLLEKQRNAQATHSSDRLQAADLAYKVSADIGPKLTGTEKWPTVQTWRTLNNVKRGGVTTIGEVMQIITWMVPAMYRTSRLARKAYRLAAGDMTDDVEDGT